METKAGSKLDQIFAGSRRLPRQETTCPECGGSGVCQACGGFRIDFNGNPCQVCRETGKCPICGGRGKVRG